MKKVGTAAKKKAIVYKYNREKDEIRNEPNEHDMIARHFIELEDIVMCSCLCITF